MTATAKKRERKNRAVVKDYVTVGDFARFAGVSPRKAQQWVDDGLVPCFRLPGSAERRMPREDVMKFLVRHGFPIPAALGGAVTYVVLLAGPCPGVRDALEAANGLSGYRCVQVADAFQAGEAAALTRGDCWVIDLMAGVAAARAILAGLKRLPHWAGRWSCWAPMTIPSCAASPPPTRT